MPDMTPSLTSILLTIAGAVLANATVLAVLGYLGRQFLQWSVSRDLERFKAELKRDADAEVERVKGELSREIESYKVKLKKSESLFEREIAAAQSFARWFGDTDPRKDHPHMEWEDAMDAWVERSGPVKDQLHDYLILNGPALLQGEREQLESAISVATDLWLESYPAEQARKIAADLRSSLLGFREALLERVRTQSSL